MSITFFLIKTIAIVRKVRAMSNLNCTNILKHFWLDFFNNNKEKIHKLSQWSDDLMGVARLLLHRLSSWSDDLMGVARLLLHRSSSWSDDLMGVTGVL